MSPDAASHGPGQMHQGRREKGEGSPDEKGGARESAPFLLPHAVAEQFNPVFKHYFKLGEALSKDDFPTAVKHASELADTMNKISLAALDGRSREALEKAIGNVKASAERLKAAAGIAASREEFAILSELRVVHANVRNAAICFTVCKIHVVPSVERPLTRRPRSNGTKGQATERGHRQQNANAAESH